MKINILSGNNIEIPTVYKGFLWLSLSYLCGTIFLTSSKYVLNNTSQINFFYWWYGSGLVFHTLYGYNVPHKLDREIRCEISFRK
jgi:hypothetical protein